MSSLYRSILIGLKEIGEKEKNKQVSDIAINYLISDIQEELNSNNINLIIKEIHDNKDIDPSNSRYFFICNKINDEEEIKEIIKPLLKCNNKWFDFNGIYNETWHRITDELDIELKQEEDYCITSGLKYGPVNYARRLSIDYYLNFDKEINKFYLFVDDFSFLIDTIPGIIKRKNWWNGKCYMHNDAKWFYKLGYIKEQEEYYNKMIKNANKPTDKKMIDAIKNKKLGKYYLKRKDKIKLYDLIDEMDELYK